MSPSQPDDQAKPAPAPPPTGEQDPQALRAERDDLLARLQRVSADFLNYQKRVAKDVAQARQFANESLMKALLAVLDDMDRALEAAEGQGGQGRTGEASPSQAAGENALLTGMRLVRQKALETLKEFGLETVEAAGEPFDPEHHSAVAQEATAAAPPGTVVRELRKGYRLRGRTIRPATVVVAAAPCDESEEAP